MFQKSEVEEKPPELDSYSSSGVYKDIEGETSDARNVTSEDYSDDDYGDVDDDADEKLILSDADDENNEEPAQMVESGQADLPVETLEPVKKKRAKKKIASVSKFKNGMYRASVNCSMRAKASAKSKKVGTVKKGKKLWMEKHNKNWVKVFKKSGPVYINKLCL